MVVSTIILVFGCTAILAFLNVCNPSEVMEGATICKPRFTPGEFTPYLVAAGGVFGGTTVFLYRENKRAAVKNGK